MATIVFDNQIIRIGRQHINVLREALACYANEMWDSYQEYLKQGKERNSHREKSILARELERKIGDIFSYEWKCLLSQEPNETELNNEKTD